MLPTLMLVRLYEMEYHSIAIVGGLDGLNVEERVKMGISLVWVGLIQLPHGSKSMFCRATLCILLSILLTTDRFMW